MTLSEGSVSFADWLGQHRGVEQKEWCLVGKGPSFTHFHTLGDRDWVRIGLNHVARESIVDRLNFLHVFDIEVLEAYDQSLLEKVDYLLMPDYPNEPHQLAGLKGHFHRESPKSTLEWRHHYRLIDKFNEAQRLIIYPRSGRSQSDDPIKVGSFSAATVVNLLAQSGIKKIRLLGIDGGVHYASHFTDLNETTLLSGGSDSFDKQFIDFANARNEHALSILPYDNLLQPIIYVGAEKEQRLAYDVLKYSIEKHSSYTPRVIDLSDALKNDGRFYESIKGVAVGTPFSMQRYKIPELNGYQGRAIYVDSDMQVFSDIRHLWDTPLQGGYAAAQVEKMWRRGPQLSVLLIDCERARWSIDTIVEEINTGVYDYPALIKNGPDRRGPERIIPSFWNSLEYFKKDHTRLVHYTSMKQQPWLSVLNPIARVWCETLIEAVKDGVISRETVEASVKKGWVRPSLLWQVDHSVVDPIFIPRKTLKHLDSGFVAPHLFGGSVRLSRWSGLGDQNPQRWQLRLRWLLAVLRLMVIRTGLEGIRKKISHVFFKVRRALSTGIGFR